MGSRRPECLVPRGWLRLFAAESCTWASRRNRNCWVSRNWRPLRGS